MQIVITSYITVKRGFIPFKFNPITHQLDIVAPSGPGSGAIFTINTIPPDSLGNFTISIANNFGTAQFIPETNAIALQASTPAGNTGWGSNNLNGITSGVQNSAFGASSLPVNATGSQNAAFAAGSLFKMISGSFNTSIGTSSLGSLVSGSDNIAIGFQALYGITVGNYNVAIGSVVANNYISNESSNIIISNPGVTGESNTIRIGTQGTSNSQQNKCFIAGIYNNNSSGFSSPLAVYVDSSTGQLGYGSGGGGINYTLTPLTHSSSPYTVLSTDVYLQCDTTAGVLTINLPNTTGTGRGIIIKDATGQAAAHNITLTTPGGSVTIDGATSKVMNLAYESLTLIFDGSGYEII